MRKLLSAGLMRLRKAKIFWIVWLFMSGFGLFAVSLRYFDILRYGDYATFDDTLFAYVIFIGICCAIFCGSFLGTEYNDGTIRNKLIVGHKRRDIYFTNLIATFATALLMMAGFLLAYCPLGALVTTPPELSAGMILLYVAVSLFTIAAFASIFNMIAMLIQNKSVSSVVCILFFFVLLMIAVVIYGKLEAPEFVTNYYLTIDGLDMTEPEPNPKYLRGIAREIYQTFFDLLPSGQALQLSGRMAGHPILMILYSVGITVATSVGGAWAFEKKDLR